MGEKLGQRNPTLPHHERAGAGEPLPEFRQSAEAPQPRAALDFDANQVRTAGEHEVDLVRPVAPIGQPHRTSPRVMEVCSDGALDEAPPERPVSTDCLEGASQGRRHQRGIEHVQLGARGPARIRLGGVPGKTSDEASVRKQIEVGRQRGRVSGLLQLAQHLVVRQHLAGIPGGQLHQAAHERRLVHPGQGDDVPLDGGRDDRIENSPSPDFQVAGHGCRAGVAAEEQVFVDAEAKRGRHLGEGPVAGMHWHETAHDGLVAAGQHRPGSGSAHDHAQRAAGSPVPVPLGLYDGRPALDVLDFVQGQDKAPRSLLGVPASLLPGVQEPCGPHRVALFAPLVHMFLEALIDRKIAARDVHASERLADHRGLARLTGSGKRDDPWRTRRGEEMDELVQPGALEGMHGAR